MAAETPREINPPKQWFPARRSGAASAGRWLGSAFGLAEPQVPIRAVFVERLRLVRDAVVRDLGLLLLRRPSRLVLGELWSSPQVVFMG